MHTLQVRILNILYLWSLSFLLILGLVSLRREFDPEFRLVASSYHRKNDKTDLFFGHLDFTDGQAIFQQVQYSLVSYIVIYASMIGFGVSRSAELYPYAVLFF